MHLKNLVVIALFGLAIGSIAALFVVAEPERPTEALSVAGGVIGQAWNTPDHLISLKLRNPNRCAVNVTGILTSCICTSPQFNTFVISPGAERMLPIHLNLSTTRFSPGEASADFQSQITLINNEGLRQDVPLRGTVNRWAEVNVDAVRFGAFSNLTSSIPRLELTLDNLSDDAEIEVLNDAKVVTVDLIRSSQTQWRIAVKANVQSLDIGQFQSAILISKKGSSKEPPLKIPVTGTAVHDVVANPQMLSFGFVEKNKPVNLCIDLESLSDLPFSVSSIDCPPTLSVNRTIDERRWALSYQGLVSCNPKRFSLRY